MPSTLCLLINFAKISFIFSSNPEIAFGIFFGLSSFIVLIEEIHTPDSSRYFFAESYAERQAQKLPQKQLSKEFVRQWLISKGFQGFEGQRLPPMPKEFITSVSERYIELYENIMGTPFLKDDTTNIKQRIEENVMKYLRGNFKNLFNNNFKH